MNGPQKLERHVGKLKTSAGAFFPGERAVFRGHDLHTSLNDLDWLELYLFGITGKRYSKEQVKVLHALWTYSSYPDARLWNNRVAALAGTSRSTGILGITAALAVSEAQLYGWGAVLRVSEFLARAKTLQESGGDLRYMVMAELRQKRNIAGYGRPIVSADERIAPMVKLLRELRLDDGQNLKIAFEIERILSEGRWRLRMNYAALSAAIAADFGLSPKEAYLYGMAGFYGGMPPCYVDALSKPEGQLFPIPCRMIECQGSGRRRWDGAR